jgi:hypothetical protein
MVSSQKVWPPTHEAGHNNGIVEIGIYATGKQTVFYSWVGISLRQFELRPLTRPLSISQTMNE